LFFNTISSSSSFCRYNAQRGTFKGEKNKSRETSLAHKTLELDHASSSSSSSSSCKHTVDNENSFFFGQILGSLGTMERCSFKNK